jgi:hypothetical protein
MNALVTAFHLACGKAPDTPEHTPARRAQLALVAFLAALPIAAVWGAAVGSSTPVLAGANLYKLPLLLLFASLVAAPPALIAFKLIVGAEHRARELVYAYAISIFFGAVTLLALTPIVALYYHSSVWAGPVIALASVGISLACGAIAFVRTLHASGAGPKIAVPATILALVFGATLFQLASVFAPILPEHTPFREGIDAAADGY